MPKTKTQPKLCTWSEVPGVRSPSVLRQPDGKFRRQELQVWLPHARVGDLILEHHGVLMPYRDLPAPAQLSLAMYHAVDDGDENWEIPKGEWFKGPYPEDTSKQLTDWLPFFQRKYGHQWFGYVEIPTLKLLQETLLDRHIPGDHLDPPWRDVNKFYWGLRNKQPRTTHTADADDPWAVILSRHYLSTIEDGWNRFWMYCHRGLTKIPCVFYPA